ncbi:metallophosphoesterase [Ekhidna sp.]
MSEVGDLVVHKPNVHSVKIKMNASRRYKLGLFSDIHFDSQYCHREMFARHLSECDGAIIIGDLFDVMGCFRDPRSKPENIRPEYIRKDKGYLDTVIEDCAKFLEPYKEKILLIGKGNHETEIQRRHDTDILDRLAFLLRMDGGSQVQTGGYSGFVRLVFNVSNTQRFSNLIYYHHGAGGNAQRSKSILRSQIDVFKVPDADINISGHTHDKIYDPSNTRMRLTDNNEIVFDSVDWLKTGSYKRDDVNPGMAGFEVQKDFLPKLMGGWFAEFRVNKEDGNARSLKRRIYQAD